MKELSYSFNIGQLFTNIKTKLSSQYDKVFNNRSKDEEPSEAKKDSEFASNEFTEQNLVKTKNNFDSSQSQDLFSQSDPPHISSVSTAKRKLFSTASEEIPAQLDSNNENNSVIGPSRIKKSRVDKKLIINFIENLLSVKITGKVLISIEDRDDGLTILTLGREDTLGGKGKQMRHVTPYSFIVRLIETIISDEYSQESIISIAKSLKPIINSAKGFGFSSETLNSSPCKNLRPYVEKTASKILITDDKKVYIVSPVKMKHPDFTPTKEDKAGIEFDNNFFKYIELAFEKLGQSIDDSNTLQIAIETILRLILGYANKLKNVAFPTEGNSQTFEIRLYPSEYENQSCSGNYNLISIEGLKFMYDTNRSSIEKKVRIVNCEGPNTTKILKAIKIIADLIIKHCTTEEVNEVLEHYNNNTVKLVLANNSELHEYNENLTKENYVEKTSNQLAKLLYHSFDFKALEKVVLAPTLPNEKANFSLYDGATAKQLTDFSFFDGADFRQKSISAAKSNNRYTKDVNFREEKINLDFLEKKLVEHFIITIFPNHSFIHGFKISGDFLQDTLKALFHLVALDYNLDEMIEKTLFVKAQKDYIYLTTDQYPEINSSNTKIELKVEGQDFSHVLGASPEDINHN